MYIHYNEHLAAAVCERECEQAINLSRCEPDLKIVISRWSLAKRILFCECAPEIYEIRALELAPLTGSRSAERLPPLVPFAIRTRPEGQRKLAPTPPPPQQRRPRGCCFLIGIELLEIRRFFVSQASMSFNLGAGQSRF
jgi:hypothetical protein